MGYAGFICNENADLDEIINKADETMYQDKAKRRASIRKEI